jgi:hypothetical protein
MEEMQRKFRDELDAIRQSWGARLGSGSVTPRYDFSRLPPFQRIARAAGGHATRAEMIYEHLQEEIRHWQAQAGNDEYLVVSAGATPVDIIQIGNISYRNPDLLILEGVDDTGQRTRILAPAGTVQLVMKIVKAKGEESEPSVAFQFGGQQESN